MKNEPLKNGIVNLWDLPKKEVYLDLRKDYKRKFLETAKNSTGKYWNDLARRLKLPISKYNDSVIRSFIRGRLTSLDLITRISSLLVHKGYKEFSLLNVQKNISKLGCMRSRHHIKNPKFPFNFNTIEGAIIISSLFHDGGITVRDLEPFYANLSKALKNRFKDSVLNLFGEISCRERDKDLTFPKILGLVLITLGLVPGRRSINNPKFPEFIFEYPEKLILVFLAQAIADDGWIYSPDKGFGFIGFNFTIDLTKFPSSKRKLIRKNRILCCLPNTLLGDLSLFRKLGCKVSGPYFGNEKIYFNDDKEVRYTQEWRIQIRGHNNFQYLSKNLKIPLKYKQKKLLNEANKVRLRRV
ncbi:MAG: hypothetical protein KKG75_04035 [Nanoarchaeota archaeon]|nr:hypothetical protein [Nanoarchaeota archaeon]